MNKLDKIYYQLILSFRPKVWLLASFVFMVLSIFGILTSSMEFPVRSIGFLFWSISSLLSSNLFLKSWCIDAERFPNGVRKYILIASDLVGFLMVLTGLGLFLFKGSAF